ncbi:16690_t:CDS:1, partial [Dentiscutata heterogama]
MKRKLGIFKNLQQELCCNLEEFDRKHFYIEMKKEGNRSNTEICPSKWSMFLFEAISYLQRDFDRKRGGYIDKKEVIAEIHKEIFPE